MISGAIVILSCIIAIFCALFLKSVIDYWSIKISNELGNDTVLNKILQGHTKKYSIISLLVFNLSTLIILIIIISILSID